MQADTSSPEDVLYEGGDPSLRYLGHDKAVYAFILTTQEQPDGFVFILRLNPQSIEQAEEAAVTITPTQGGGKFIENQGNIFKDITISGTTGFIPPKMVQSIPAAVTFEPDSIFTNTVREPLKSAPAAFAPYTGYNHFLALRSLFRTYWQTHRLESDEARAACKLYWVNLKDEEQWLVEPMSFNMSRASRSPMTYAYNIRLRTIAKAALTQIPSDASSLAKTALNNNLAGVVDAFNLALTLMRGANAAISAFNTLRRTVAGVIETVARVTQGLEAIVAGFASVLDMPRSLLMSAQDSINSAIASIERSAELVLSLPVDLMDGLVLSKQNLDNVLARPEMFAKRWSERWALSTENFNRTYGIGGTAAPTLDLGARKSGLMEATPNKGETIYQFAQRTTGDANNAANIIVANNLQWPYFSPSAEERAPGTVAPGDAVLVPVPYSTNLNNNLTTTAVGTTARTFKEQVASATATSLSKQGVTRWRTNEWVGYTVELLSGVAAGQRRLITANTATMLTVNEPWATLPPVGTLFRIYFQKVSATDKPGIIELLGVDLRITVADQKAGTWDLVRAGDGDLSTIRGQDNLNQALSVKLLTTQGDLILHPWFGLKPAFGQRGTPENVFRLRLFIEATLLSDSRIESVPLLNVVQVGDKYRTEAKLAVKGGLRSQFSSPLL